MPLRHGKMIKHAITTKASKMTRTFTYRTKDFIVTLLSILGGHQNRRLIPFVHTMVIQK